MSLEKFNQIVTSYENVDHPDWEPQLQGIALPAGAIILGGAIKSVRSFGYGKSPLVALPHAQKREKTNLLVGVWGVEEAEQNFAWHIGFSDMRQGSGATLHRIASDRRLDNLQEPMIVPLAAEGHRLHIDPGHAIYVDGMLLEPLEMATRS